MYGLQSYTRQVVAEMRCPGSMGRTNCGDQTGTLSLRSFPQLQGRGGETEGDRSAAISAGQIRASLPSGRPRRRRE